MLKEEVGYRALHLWVQSELGKPDYCFKCKSTDPNKKYEWANISGEYKRDLSDWARLCFDCHRGKGVPWNGKKGRMKKNKTFSLSQDTLDQIMFVARRNYWRQTEVIAEAIQRLYAEEKSKETQIDKGTKSK